MYKKYKSSTKSSVKPSTKVSSKTLIKPSLFAKYLLIVESPSKCAKIEHYLGKEYQCIATKGHIRALDGLKSIDENFEITFQICKDKLEHVEWMKTIIEHYQKDNIILASDDDREGEAIAYHICQVFDLPIETTKRILFHEITQSAILESLRNPITINMNIVNAQKTRQIIDVLIGFKISPLLWKYIYSSSTNSLSAGRGQTPALRLIYDNAIAPKNAVEIKYKTSAFFFQDNVKFVLNREFTEKKSVLKFLENSKGFSNKLYLGEKQFSKSSAPKPFNTSALLQAASNILHYSPKQTMQIAQQLYQDGYITYMRTDNTNYSQEFLEKSRLFIIKEYGSDKYLRKPEIRESLGKDDKNVTLVKSENQETGFQNQEFLDNSKIQESLDKPEIQESLDKPEIQESLGKDDKNVTLVKSENQETGFQNQESLDKSEILNPHEAIRIIDFSQTVDKITDQNAASLYKLIYKHTLESCMSDYESNKYKVTITSPQFDDFQDLEYNYILEIPVFLGWKRSINKTDELQNKQTGLLFHFQLIQSKNIITPNWIESIITVHNTHHNYYSESSLIQKLEKMGIGRPSTYALLVETNQDRGYVKCKDLDGITMNCEEYKLVGQILEESNIDRTFGQEKNKLIIQPIGILCIEFLIKHFNPLFSYEYTKNMEDELDKITTQDTIIHLCTKCTNEIHELIKPVAKIEKKQYKIDDTHFLVFNQYGTTIKHIINGVTEYLPVKKDMVVDLEKLKKKEYTLDELLEFENANLGKYNDQDLFLRIGKYGNYVEWGENKVSIKDIQIPLKDITIKDIEQFFLTQEKDPDPDQHKDPNQEYSREDHPSNRTIIRDLNKELSIRKGKFGIYVYYKTKTMKIPKFYNIKGDKIDLIHGDTQTVIEWIENTYIK